MTDYGALIKNTSGRVCIDSTYKNHVFHQKGSTLVSQYMNEINMVDSTESCLLFIKPPVGIYAAPVGFIKTGTVYDKLVIAASGAGTVEWIVFKEGPAIPSSNEYGFFVYDSAGEVVFNSNEKYINIIDDFQFVGNNIAADQNITITSANNYFWINGSCYSFGYVGHPTHQLYRNIQGIKYHSDTIMHIQIFSFFTEAIDLGASSVTGTGYKSPSRIIEIENRNF